MDNKLIIRKNLKKEIKKIGISKATPEAVEFFLEKIKEFILNSLLGAKENMDSNARKIMQKQDIMESLKKSEKEFDL